MPRTCYLVFEGWQAMRKKPLAEQDADQLRVLGSTIRDSRRGRLSLEGLARRANISTGQLSHIENGTGNPSVEMLIRIADALGLDLTDLVEQPPTGQTYVVRAGQRRRYRSPILDHDVDLITPGLRHELSVSYCVRQLGVQVSQRQQPHGGVLYHVLSGELEVKKANAVYRVRAGDSLLLALPHPLASADGGPAKFIAVFRPEEAPVAAERNGGNSGTNAAVDGDNGEIERARSQQVGRIGQRIRELRRERMTLAELAQASKVSTGLLSRLENGVGNPSFASLSAIARALDVSVHAFIESSSDDDILVTNEDRITLRRARSDAELELLVPSLSSRIIGMLMTLPPGYTPGEPTGTRPGQQFEVVLDGTVQYHIEHEVYELKPGDFILFEASRPHSRSNLDSSVKAKILSFSTEARLESYFPPKVVATAGKGERQ